MSEWRPIETAPKNIEVLLWVPVLIGKPLVRQGSWFYIDKEQYGWIDTDGDLIEATHWMPIPEAPK